MGNAAAEHKHFFIFFPDIFCQVISLATAPGVDPNRQESAGLLCPVGGTERIGLRAGGAGWGKAARSALGVPSSKKNKKEKK
jgi:hypothetical protein